MNKEASLAFGRRLTEVCQLDGITVPQLAKLCEVTERTAQRWLRGQSKPTDAMRGLKYARRLNVDIGWLFVGRGPDPKRFRFHQQIDSLSEWERHRFWRLLFLCTNGSARANRLLDMAAAGQISRTQLFRTM